MEEKKFKHIMIDTETLGRTPGSVVRSVAAIEFNPQTGETGRRKVWKIDLADSIRYGFRIEASTLKWWMMQSDAARRNFVEGAETLLVDFMEELMDFMTKQTKTETSRYGAFSWISTWLCFAPCIPGITSTSTGLTQKCYPGTSGRYATSGRTWMRLLRQDSFRPR